MSVKTGIKIGILFVLLSLRIYSIGEIKKEKIEEEKIKQEIIKIALGEWRPYISKTTKENLMERIIAELFELKGLEYETVYMSWGEAYEKTLAGETHLTFPWVKTSEREQSFLFVDEPFFQEDYVFFYKKGTNFKWSSFDDLKKYRFGATKGYYQTEYYNHLGLSFIESDTESMNLAKILSGEIDAYLASYRVVVNLIKRDFPEQKELFENDLSPFSYINSYIMLSQNVEGADSLKIKLKEGLRELKTSGRYDQIIDEFFEEYY